MRIVATGDTHGRFPELPEGDVLVHTGDGTLYGGKSDVEQLDNWFGDLNFRHIIYVPGNHDFYFAEGLPDVLRNAIVLVNRTLVIDGVKFWGSPYTPKFGAFVFMREDAILRRLWEEIPDDVDILITHGPPNGILDCNVRGEYVGSLTLRERVDQIRPKHHVFGHIHEAYGNIVYNGTIFWNVSYVNEFYQPANKPIVIEL